MSWSKWFSECFYQFVDQDITTARPNGPKMPGDYMLVSYDRSIVSLSTLQELIFWTMERLTLDGSPGCLDSSFSSLCRADHKKEDVSRKDKGYVRRLPKRDYPKDDPRLAAKGFFLTGG